MRFNDLVPSGDTWIYYCKPEHTRTYGFGDVIPEALGDTHTLLGSVQWTDLEEIFMRMQGEAWSPRGEANALLTVLGLGHTSMSVGDVIVLPDGSRHLVKRFGFSTF